MNAIIDEGVPLRLVRLLRDIGHDVSRFPSTWKGLKNGQLLAQLEDAGFTCLITCDRSLRFQQNLARSKLSLIVLPAQRFPDLVPYQTQIAEAFLSAEAGKVLVVARAGRSG